jgi:hypothetical protein
MKQFDTAPIERLEDDLLDLAADGGILFRLWFIGGFFGKERQNNEVVTMATFIVACVLSARALSAFA